MEPSESGGVCLQSHVNADLAQQRRSKHCAHRPRSQTTILYTNSSSASKMPGRVSTRTSTASRVTRKSSTTTLASSRPSTNATVPEEAPPNALRNKICTIFADAQKTTAGHRKLIVNLRKLHEDCCYEPQSKKGGPEFTEEDFNYELGRCVLRVMPIKKSESVGDRIVRFLGQFLSHASEKGEHITKWEVAATDRYRCCTHTRRRDRRDASISRNASFQTHITHTQRVAATSSCKR